MNADWINFLKSNNATFTENSEINFPEHLQVKADTITAIAHLAIIKVTGKDAAKFLQGQLTCNINELTESNSFFAAFCNAKGRTISTLLILKNEANFLLVLPKELIGKVIKKLQMYILRSDVQLNNVTDEFCLIGVTDTKNHDLLTSPPVTDFAVTNDSEIIIKFPSNDHRYLIISSASRMELLWTQLLQNDDVYTSNSNLWLYQDVSAGLPWLTEATSEEFIPQMLNIDKLGGISFNKGCYTGQEIIARTHYLGKAKRELFLAECGCNDTTIIDTDNLIISDKDNQPIGKVLSIQSNGQNYRLLIVMPTDAELKNLILSNSNQAKISFIDFH